MSTRATVDSTPHSVYYLDMPSKTDHTQRLPAEILELILVHLKSSDPTSKDGFKASWIRATWVCRRWREIALQYSALWSATTLAEHSLLSGDPFDAARVLLARASSRELDLTATLPALHVVGPNAHRVRSLEVLVAPHYSGSYSTTDAIRSLPALGTILVRLSLVGHDSNFFTGLRNPIITLHAFAFPVLRVIEIKTVSLKIVGCMLNLDTFKATDCEGCMPRHQDIKDLLRAMPNIGHIEFRSSVPAVENLRDRYPLSDNNPVHLPKLWHLGLRELAWDIAPVLQMIAIPPTAHLFLRGQYGGVYSGRRTARGVFRRDMIPYDLHPLAQFSDAHALELAVTIPSGGNVSMLGSRLDNNTNSLIPIWTLSAEGLVDMDPPFTAVDSARNLADCCEAIIHEVHTFVSPQQLLVLSIAIPTTIPLWNNWAMWLQPFKNIREISLVGSALVRDIIGVLEAYVYLLPALRGAFLWLDTPDMAPGAARALEQWLWNRAQRGMRLMYIGFGPCSPQADTHAMTEVVQRLVGCAARHVQNAHPLCHRYKE
ncbi:hypothetical protein C8Q73DRAFT_664354 [Cubamyces lactineus]|nr:hypothetical protein C8Q73DRAFT_664354 [Cubamyces lactineus]